MTSFALLFKNIPNEQSDKADENPVKTEIFDEYGRVKMYDPFPMYRSPNIKFRMDFKDLIVDDSYETDKIPLELVKGFSDKACSVNNNREEVSGQCMQYENTTETLVHMQDNHP